VDHIQVHKSNDDGIEFWGGSVDAKYLMITQAGDDGIDWAYGYTGRLQFIVVQQIDEGDAGLEGDNSEIDANDEPVSAPYIANATIIGDGESSEVDGANAGVHLRRGGYGKLDNAIIANFSGACFAVTGADSSGGVGAQITLMNSVLVCTPAASEGNQAETLVNHASNIEVSELSDVALVDPQNPTAPDFRPTAASPARGIGSTSGGFFDVVTYAGAFSGTNDAWADGWTAFPED
jgi:hypothetical protein